MSIINAPLTAERYAASPAGVGRTELVRGEIVATMPPARPHAVIAAALVTMLHMWRREGRGGEIGTEAGFILRRDPDTVRAPDCYYIRPGNPLMRVTGPGFADGAPDLAVEIVSPSNTATELRERIADYHAAGTVLVWIIMPERREIVIHHRDGSVRTLAGEDALSDDEILPGLTATVADLFA